ncbi:portal protein, partial [Herbiconiux daphne]
YQSPFVRGRLDTPQSIDPKQRRISIVEHYIYSSFIHPKGETRPYQVVTCGDELLSFTEVKRFPFVVCKMERSQGQFLGRGLFHLAKQFQDSLSLSQRMHEQVALRTTYPQYQAVKGQYDKQSLLQNRPGSVIEVAQIGAVDRFQPLQLTETYVAANNQLKEVAQETLTQPTDITNGDGGMSQVATATAY